MNKSGRIKKPEYNRNLAVCQVLKSIRIVNSLSIKELAEKIQFTPAYICEIESGKRNPSLEVITRYSEAFNIPRSSILFFSEEKENENYDDQRIFLEILQSLSKRVDPS